MASERECRMVVQNLRNYRTVSYGQFDQEYKSEVPLNQDAANIIEELLKEIEELNFKWRTRNIPDIF